MRIIKATDLRVEKPSWILGEAVEIQQEKSERCKLSEGLSHSDAKSRSGQGGPHRLGGVWGALFWAAEKRQKRGPQVRQSWKSVWQQQRAGGERVGHGGRKGGPEPVSFRGHFVNRGDCRAWRGEVMGSHLGSWGQPLVAVAETGHGQRLRTCHPNPGRRDGGLDRLGEKRPRTFRF